MLRIPFELESKLDRVQRSGSQLKARCPSHPDDVASLAIKPLDDGKILLSCHAGCETKDILDALGLPWSILMGDSKPKEREEWTPIKDATGRSIQPVAVYRYVDEKGILLYEVCRFVRPDGKKDFRQRRPDPAKPDKWVWNMRGVRRVLYRLPKVIDAVARGEVTLVVEGERDVLTAEDLGLVATTSPMGAGKFEPEMADVFKDGAPVVILADADEAGYKHARMVKELIDAVGGTTRLAECAAGCKDLTDHVTAGYGVDDIVYLDEEPLADLGLIDLHDLLDSPEPEYEWLVPGLMERGERFMLTGREGLGKALALSTKIVTPTGWTTMGKVAVGDQVIDRDGQPCRVVGVSHIEVVEAHRVTFSDGSEILACADHQWLTQTNWERRRTAQDAQRANHSKAPFPLHEEIRTTREIMGTLLAGSAPVNNHSIAATKPLELPEAELPIDPYLLGLWLAGEDVNEAAASALVRTEKPQNGVRVTLETMGMFRTKRIPIAFLRASSGQRLALLQGLMHSIGTVTRRLCEIPLPCPVGDPLVADIVELLYSLGFLLLRPSEPDRLQFIARPLAPTTPQWADSARLRYITDVEPTGVLMPMRCISVDSPSRTYLIGKGMIPTHNTVWLRQFAVAVAAGIHPFEGSAIEPRRVIWFDAENSMRQNRRQFEPLLAVAQGLARDVPRGGFGLFLRPEGLDLTREEDALWFHQRILVTKPDLVIIGPWYRLFNSDPSDEQKSREVIAQLDAARARYGFAIMIEAHSPHADGFRTNARSGSRPVRPIGSSILLRWPEFGFGLSFRAGDDGPWGLPDASYADFIAWRGARDEREWPEAFERSNDDRDWPWLRCDPRPLKDELAEIREDIARGKRVPKSRIEWGSDDG